MNWSPLNVRIHSRTPRIRTLLPADAGGSFVNGLQKTNVCFAAACFSLRSLHYSIKGDVHDPLYFYMYYTFIKLLSFYQCANTLGSHKLIPGTKVISSRVMIMHR